MILLTPETEMLHTRSLDHFPFLAIHISSSYVTSFIRSLTPLCLCSLFMSVYMKETVTIYKILCVLTIVDTLRPVEHNASVLHDRITGCHKK